MWGEGVITAKCDEGEWKVTESRRGWECIAALVFGPMVLPFFPEYGHVILVQHPDKPVDYQVQETRLDARSQIEG